MDICFATQLYYATDLYILIKLANAKKKAVTSTDILHLLLTYIELDISLLL